MEIGRCLSILALICVTLLAFYSSGTEACSCMIDHPQSHYCKADYAVLIRVLRKSRRLMSNKLAFKMEVKKTYKKSPNAHRMLKNGLIVTSSSDAGCGVNLDIGKLYMIAGRGQMLSMCDYVKEYKNMSKLERGGFAAIYRKGCTCDIKPCFGNQCLRAVNSETSCQWSPFSKCETEYGACMRSTYQTPEGTISKCIWRRTEQYKKCMLEP